MISEITGKMEMQSFCEHVEEQKNIRKKRHTQHLIRVGAVKMDRAPSEGAAPVSVEEYEKVMFGLTVLSGIAGKSDSSPPVSIRASVPIVTESFCDADSGKLRGSKEI